jgi:hypothetical protein
MHESCWWENSPGTAKISKDIRLSDRRANYLIARCIGRSRAREGVHHQRCEAFPFEARGSSGCTNGPGHGREGLPAVARSRSYGYSNRKWWCCWRDGGASHPRRDVPCNEDRGKIIDNDIAPAVIATLHPSAILRAPDEKAREMSFKLLVTDLKLAVKRAKRVL